VKSLNIGDKAKPDAPAIFIDRDGTLNEETNFLSQPEGVALIPGASKAIAKLNAKQIPIIVITNQSGIGRGLYGWEAYHAVMEKICELLAQDGAHIDDSSACPFHEEGLGEYGVANHPDRKPNPGMIASAAKKHGITLETSWMIGDKTIDLEAGRRAGCRTALVLTGYGKSADRKLADIVADDLGSAIEQILPLL
jgi:D-glycero-D-manno-heptose 1,7-bisphosphate phosphatase